MLIEDSDETESVRGDDEDEDVGEMEIECGWWPKIGVSSKEQSRK